MPAVSRPIFLASIGPLAGADGVERNADGTPSAFRIWRAGANPTDHGVHYFTPESARLLTSQQIVRGNRFSVDVDHMSLNQESPPESRKAVGWHSLEVRENAEKEPELWATACEWTTVVAGGLASSPPEWRYFSPAYDVDKTTGSITRYLNTALTNNPATWSVTALASAGTHATESRKMAKKYEALLADAMCDDPEKKNAALAAFAAAFPDPDEKGDKKDDKKEEAAKKASASEEDEKKKKDEEKEASVAAAEEEEKKAAKASETSEEKKASMSLAREVQDLKSQMATDRANLAKEKEDSVRASLFAKRPDFSVSQKTILAKLPLADVEAAVKEWPRVVATPGSSVNASLAGGAGPAETRSAGRAMHLNPDQHRILANIFKAPDSVAVRATQVGSSLFMPNRNVSTSEAAARVKELDAELIELSAELGL